MTLWYRFAPAVLAAVVSIGPVWASTVDQSGYNYLNYAFEYNDGSGWTELFSADVEMAAAQSGAPDRPDPLGSTITWSWDWERGATIGMSTPTDSYRQDVGLTGGYVADFGTGADVTTVGFSTSFATPHLSSLSINIGADGVATGASVWGKFTDGYNASFGGSEKAMGQSSDVLHGSLHWMFGDMPTYDPNAFSVSERYDTRIISTVSLYQPSLGLTSLAGAQVFDPVAPVPLPLPFAMLLGAIFGLGALGTARKKAA